MNWERVGARALIGVPAGVTVVAVFWLLWTGTPPKEIWNFTDCFVLFSVVWIMLWRVALNDLRSLPLPERWSRELLPILAIGIIMPGAIMFAFVVTGVKLAGAGLLNEKKQAFLITGIGLAIFWTMVGWVVLIIRAYLI